MDNKKQKNKKKMIWDVTGQDKVIKRFLYPPYPSSLPQHLVGDKKNVF